MDKLNILRAGFRSGITLDLNFRLEQLAAFQRLVTENAEALCDALWKDLRKSKHESQMCEINIVLAELDYFIKNLRTLVAPEKAHKLFITMTDSTYVVPQPYGVVLNISAWNYPISLTLQPIIGAIAAGNVVLAKPSELSVNSEKIIADLIPKYIDSRVCQVFCGGPEETSNLLKERFDYICYTGSTRIGRVVMAAAAPHLTPVTLELGGKSPVYIDQNVNLSMAVKRIVWGKFVNAGQTCIAPDYVLCHKDILEEFVNQVKATINEFFGSDPVTSPDFGRIVNQRNFDRLEKLLSSSQGTVVVTGEHKRDQLFIAPTVLRDIQNTDSLMSEELFGPIMPIISVKSSEEAIEFILNREKPLALYVFTKKREIMNEFELKTSSGAIVYNDVLIHCGIHTLPFGGVGESGMGNYHGKYSIEAFSHKRAVLDKDTTEMFNNMLRYPPYDEKKSSWMNWALSTSGSKKRCCLM